MGLFGQISPALRSVGLRSEETDVSIRMAKLEAQCAEYKASFDHLKSVIQKLEEKVESNRSTITHAHEKTTSHFTDRLAKVEASIHKSVKVLKKVETHVEKELKDGGHLALQDDGHLAELGEAPDDTEREGFVGSAMASMTSTGSAMLYRFENTEIDFLDPSADEYEISLPESIYSDFVLTWARGYPFPIFTSTLLCFACIIVQFLFISIVYDISAQNEERQDMTYKKVFGKRFTDASSTYGGFTQSEYCNRSTWTWETKEMTTYEEYINVHWIGHAFGLGTPSGLVLGALSIVLWAGACTAEIRNIVDFVSMLSLPWWKGEEGEDESYDPKEGTLKSLGWRPRIAITIITVCRIGIISCLGVVGCWFLIFTTDLIDFILNAVALSFVLDMDELCYKFLSPDKQQAFKNLKDPIMSGETARAFRKLAPMAEAASLACIVIITYFSVQELVGMSSSMVESLQSLCGVGAIPEAVRDYLSEQTHTSNTSASTTTTPTFMDGPLSNSKK